jgi:alpha/beta superfamily hydrolase
MGNSVVIAVCAALVESGIAGLRFNFRGVGQSEGRYSGVEEHRDVEAAAAFLRGRLAADAGMTEPGGRRPSLALAGYSFGSVMVARAAAGPIPVQALALIAPVVTWAELPPDTLERLSQFRGPVLAVCGELDDLAPPGEVERALKALKIDHRVAVVDGAGHLCEHSPREVRRAGRLVLGRETLGRASGKRRLRGRLDRSASG